MSVHRLYLSGAPPGRLASVALAACLFSQSALTRVFAQDIEVTEKKDLSGSELVCPRADDVAPTVWRVSGGAGVTAMRSAIVDTLRLVEHRGGGLSGDVPGFRAGHDYELIYARDAATIAPMAQYLYGLPYLTRAVEEFLQLQFDGLAGDPEDAYWARPAQPGALSGVLGVEPFAAKTLVTSDEETSVIHMAYVAFRAGAGSGWLLAAQAERPRIQRLNEAMDWLYAQRFDSGLGLIKRGHTTDWGDVEVGQGFTSGPGSPDPRDWTASIFDQAWAYRALVELAEMNQVTDMPAVAQHQLTRARGLKQAVALSLWQPDRGFYRTHVHIPPLRHAFDEDSMVSIANAVAVYTGLADPTERGPIFQALETARLEAGAAKPGLSLYPPYPAGFFDYPQMSPGRYQNGAVWDWWAGTQISAEFWNGYSALARTHLDLVATDWARNAGQVFEWQEPRGRTNGGSPAYAGAASTMGEAIIAGLFGVELSPGGFGVTPRLGPQNGSIHVYQPASGCWLDYAQTYAPELVSVEWETNHSLAGTVRLLVPERGRALSLQLDGRSVPFKIERVGEDRYVVPGLAIKPGKGRLDMRVLPRAALAP